MAGVWYYLNKEIYLKAVIVSLGVLVAAIVAPFLMPSIWSGLGAAGILLVVGLYKAEWLTGLF